MTVWNAYLPIGDPLKSDLPNADPRWLSAMGVDEMALTVLRRVRQDVLPLVRRLLPQSFSFLIHDRASGVPCRPEDHQAFVHLRLHFDDRKRINLKREAALVRELIPSEWVYLTRVEPSPEERRLHEILDAQSALYLRLVEHYADLDDVALLIQIAQHLHFFANMGQMVVR